MPHCGAQQRLRALKKNWEKFEKLCQGNEYARATRERLLDMVSDEPDAEYAALHLALAAQCAADERKQPKEMVTALNQLLNVYEERAAESKKVAAEEGAVL